MLGRVRTYNPNAETSEKYVGKTVALNGSDRTATVLRAYWQGPGKPIELYLSEDTPADGVADAEFFGDTEQWTLVRSV